MNDKKPDWEKARKQMVRGQLIPRGIKDRAVLRMMAFVPRHKFIPAKYLKEAYADHPLPIGKSQTISQPYIVAIMTEFLELTSVDSEGNIAPPTKKVLEIGTGCGYQTAILSGLAREVFSIEIIPELAELARDNLARTNYVKNVHLQCGDGYAGLPEHAPFDAILVAAAPKRIPGALIHQLAEGGIMIIPVGDEYQELTLIRKQNNTFTKKVVLPVKFVPMTGLATNDRM